MTADTKVASTVDKRVSLMVAWMVALWVESKVAKRAAYLGVSVVA